MRSVFIFLLFTVSQFAVAQDYDYQRAYQDWERKKQELDVAEADLDDAERRLAPLQREYERADNEVSRLETQLSSIRSRLRRVENEIDQSEANIRSYERQKETLAREIEDLHHDIEHLEEEIDDLEDEIDEDETRLDRIERRIRELEDQPNNGEWTCVYVDRGHEEHRGGHRASNSSRSAAAEAAEADCLEFHGECRLSSCTQPDNPELERLKRERDALRSEINSKRNTLSSKERELSNKRNSKRTKENQLAQLDRQIESEERELRDLNSQRRDLEFQEQDTELSLSRARNDLADARAARDRALSAVDRARDDRDRAFNIERSAWAYYEEVKANYDRALADAQRHGRSTAGTDAGREATERSESVGETDGNASAREVGTRQGSQEAAAISHARGYGDGRDYAASDSALRTSYNRGLADGEAHANRKAQSESFPQGYNDTLGQLLANNPTNAEEIDITNSLPSIPADQGDLLSSDPRPVRQVPNPNYPLEEEPAYNVPSANPPSVRAPAADRRYYSPDCANRPLPDFVQACRESYNDVYINGFARLYQSAYNGHFSSAFRGSVEAHYRRARDARVPASWEAGRQLGANHQGVLDGFARSVAEATRAAYNRGVAAVEAYRTTGFLPVLRSVELVEGYEDDNMSPGETVVLKVVIDNYGKTTTPEGKLRLNVSDLSGGLFDLTIRDLPVMQADTSTTLIGVLTGKVAATPGISTIALTAVLEHGQGDEYDALDQASFSAGVRVPVELSAIEFPSPVQIGDSSVAILRFKNNTGRTTAESDLAVTISPDALVIDGEAPTLPEIAPGETVELPVNVQADARVGGNQIVNWSLLAQEIAGLEELLMQKGVTVPVARNASIALCLPTCGAPYQLPLRVRAGSTLRLPALFDFHADRRMPGPFVFGKHEQSDSRIRSANGSTVSVNLGSWSPNNSDYRANFAYVFPREMAGESHWVSLYLKDGRNTIHIVEIPIIVE